MSVQSIRRTLGFLMLLAPISALASYLLYTSVHGAEPAWSPVGKTPQQVSNFAAEGTGTLMMLGFLGVLSYVGWSLARGREVHKDFSVVAMALWFIAIVLIFNALPLQWFLPWPRALETQVVLGWYGLQFSAYLALANILLPHHQEESGRL